MWTSQPQRIADYPIQRENSLILRSDLRRTLIVVESFGDGNRQENHLTLLIY